MGDESASYRAAAAAPSVGAALLASRATPCLGYIAQLVPLPKTSWRKDMWAANKVWHLPAGTLSVELAAELGELGLKRIGCATTARASALVRIANDGQVQWVENLEQKKAEAMPT